MQTATIGFLGAGNMAGAIINGMLASGFDAQRLQVCDRNEPKRADFASKGLTATADPHALIAACDILVLAVKPQALKATLEPLAADFQQRQPLIVSVAAGVTAESIDRWLGGDFAIVRTMPNTPSLVLTGATGLYANANVSDAERNTVQQMFDSIGASLWVDAEDDLHAVTATSGSAPAYFFRFMEAMQKAAEAQGLDGDSARTLIVQTALGAARMVQQTGQMPAELRRQVCSPNGTTERAIRSFETDDLDAVVARAMQACRARSIELSEELAD
ncbi:pyrroline-5-carboxylate reductase [Saccharospirillum mangrovi]|uniref:pyrroline-5-carboxylate reductase n=1 Tax=Saccharospirillum mangrovi TaxID=2161747 RepID=UPI000D36066E|nr:pyrroline-5-carboxylate reductase [Saccharospirillum mangrovi]